MKHFTPVEAGRLWQAAESHANPTTRRRAQTLFSESISDSDLLPQLQPAIRRTLLASRQAIQTTAEAWTTPQTVDQIRKPVEFDWYGWNQDNIPETNHGERFIPGTLPVIRNREQYPQIELQATGLFLQADTFGEAFSIDWEAIVNSRGGKINHIRDAIDQFALHSRQHEDALPVSNLIGAAGINYAKLGQPLDSGSGSTLKLGHEIAGNPAPSAVTLKTFQDAIRKAASFKIDGVDVSITKFVLVTAPSNVTYFNQVLANRTVVQVPARTGAASTTTSAQVVETIDLGYEIEVSPNRWLTAYNNTIGGNAWFLIPIMDRPGIVRVYLEGYENPQFFLRDSNMKQIGGGDVPYTEGDFDTEGVMTKVRWAYGTSTLWGEAIMYSNGTGVATTANP